MYGAGSGISKRTSLGLTAEGISDTQKGTGMYQQKVFYCIDKAVQETKKSAPKMTIFALIAGVLLALNGLSLLFLGAGVKYLFASKEFCAILSLLAGVFFLIFAGISLKDSIKSRSSDANLRYRDEYLKRIRVIGEDSVVFGYLDTIPPIICGNKELRFDQNVVACTCEDDLDSIYVYPLSYMTNMGTGSMGSRPYLYMHFVVNGKKLKKSVELPQEQGQAIVQQLKAYNPNIKIGL